MHHLLGRTREGVRRRVEVRDRVVVEVEADRGQVRLLEGHKVTCRGSSSRRRAPRRTDRVGMGPPAVRTLGCHATLTHGFGTASGC